MVQTGEFKIRATNVGIFSFVPVCPNEFSLNPVHDVLNEALDTEAGDSTPKGVVSATQVQGPILLIAKEKSTAKFVKLSEEIKSFNASAKLRVKRTNKHHLGARLRRSAEAEKEEKKMTIAVEFITISFETISYLTSRKRGCSAEITTDLVQGFTLWKLTRVKEIRSNHKEFECKLTSLRA